jgi:hypothetical protein
MLLQQDIITVLPSSEPQGSTAPAAPAPKRKMVSAELSGKHKHTTSNGVNVHIWRRRNRYLARFRHNGRQTGPTLGATEQEAEVALRRLMVQLEDGTFLPPSDPLAVQQKRKNRPIPKLSIPELHVMFVAEKRRTRGRKTSQTYAGRLAHVDAFVEQAENKRRFPYAALLSDDGQYGLDLREFLTRRHVARNGHANSQKQLMMPSGVRNVLETHRDALNWAAKSQVRLLPPDFVQPISSETIGAKPHKDPLRPTVIGLERRLRLVRMSNAFQLITFAPQYILPLRPEQLAGLLVRDVDWEDNVLVFGTRFDEHDRTKGKTNFRVPFPEKWEPVIRIAVGERSSGPLYVRHDIFNNEQQPELVCQARTDLDKAVNSALEAQAAKGPLPDGDAKDICRSVIRKAGGVTPDELQRDFMQLANLAGFDGSFRYYDLRGSVVTEMERVGVQSHIQRYVMGQHKLDPGTLDPYRSLTIDGLRDSLQPHWDFCAELIDGVLVRGRKLELW